MRFEKWQALGNDYVIMDAEDLSFPLTPAAVRRLCDRHTGPGADGVLALSRTATPGFVARLRIFNPDGSEAELSGNGAREAILYLRRARLDRPGPVLDRDGGGGDPPDDPRPRRRAASTWGARGCGPTRSPPAARTAPARSPAAASSTSTSATRSARSASPTSPSSTRSTCPRSARRSSTTRSSPSRTNVSFWCPVGEDAIRARIFERGVGETQSSGTGACGAAVAFALAGGGSPVTVRLDGGELEVDVDESLHIDLTGWAVPVYRGALSDELVAELRG